MDEVDLTKIDEEECDNNVAVGGWEKTSGETESDYASGEAIDLTADCNSVSSRKKATRDPK